MIALLAILSWLVAFGVVFAILYADGERAHEHAVRTDGGRYVVPTGDGFEGCFKVRKHGTNVNLQTVGISPGTVVGFRGREAAVEVVPEPDASDYPRKRVSPSGYITLDRAVERAIGVERGKRVRLYERPDRILLVPPPPDDPYVIRTDGGVSLAAEHSAADEDEIVWVTPNTDGRIGHPNPDCQHHRRARNSWPKKRSEFDGRICRRCAGESTPTIIENPNATQELLLDTDPDDVPGLSGGDRDA